VSVTGPVLAFDTSGPWCSAALLADGERAAHVSEARERGQAERLFPIIEAMLAEANVAWHAIARIGVGIGPGNFTGIRVAVAAARGLAVSLGCPAVGVSRLEALAHALPRPAIATVAGRRGSVYVQAFDDPADPRPPRLTDADGLAALDLPRGAVCIGGAADAAAAATGGTARDAAHPLAEAIARIAAAHPEDRDARPAPLYLRAADAAPARETGPRRL